ncbi:MAG: hypothetical protein RL015_3226 [Verrucomicrobiota bacterium]|jgi:AraC-like DNA-binding protein
MSSPLLSTTVWQSLQFEWLWVYHGWVPVTEQWSDVVVVPAGWFWVERGSARLLVDGTEILVKPGQSFFSSPGTRCQWFASGTRLLSVGYRCQWPGGTPVFQEGLNCALGARRSLPLLEKTRRLFITVHGRRKEMPYLKAITPQSRSWADCCRQEAAFRDWFAEYVLTLQKHGLHPQPPASFHDRRLDVLMQALQAWPLDQPLKLARLSAETDLGERRVHDLLKQHLGMTAQTWLDKRRLLVAREHLTSSNISLKEIAFQLGFRHPPHFTHWFKRHTHMTPTAFRLGHGADAA